MVDVTENVTNVSVTDATTVTVTKSVTNVDVTDGTATLTVTPSETVVNITGNTTIDVAAQPQTINITDDAIGTHGAQTLFGNLTIKQDAEGAEQIYLKGINTKTDYAQGESTNTKLFELQEHDGNPICFFGYRAPQIGGNNYFISSPNLGLQFFKNYFNNYYIQPISGAGTILPDTVELGEPDNKFKVVNTQKVAFGGTKNITDFEHGTFTPNISASQTNQLQFAYGRYVKAQNLVTVHISFKFFSTPAGLNGWVDNLPFVVAAYGGSVGLGVKGGNNYFAGQIVDGYARMLIRNTDGTAHTVDTSVYQISATYKVA